MRILILVLAWVLCVPHSAQAGPKIPLMVEGEQINAPSGWVQFCEVMPAYECHFDVPPHERVIVLTNQVWDTLRYVNHTVNQNIVQISDKEQWGVEEKWSYPDEGKGDCEDLVLLKRRMLQSAGYPIDTPLITFVRDQKGNGHAVLTVRTNRGDLILDNEDPIIHLWHDTKYKFVKRQSAVNPTIWVSLEQKEIDALEQKVKTLGVRIIDPDKLKGRIQNRLDVRKPKN